MKKIGLVLLAVVISVAMCACGIGKRSSINENNGAADNLLTQEPTKRMEVIEGSGQFRGLAITARCETANKVEIHFENTSSDGYSLGWVNGPTLTCTTTNGEYYFDAPRMQIGAGQSGDLTGYFDNASGDIISVSISNMHILDGRGLPTDFSDGETVVISFGEQQDKVESDSSVTYSGAGNFDGLEIEVTAKGVSAVTVNYTNNTSEGYSLGWVNGVTVTCSSSEGDFYYSSNRAVINPGESVNQNYYFENAAGIPTSVTITGIHHLQGSGLPADFGDGGSVTILLN